VHQQIGQQPHLSRASNRTLPPTIAELDRTEDPELHHSLHRLQGDANSIADPLAARPQLQPRSADAIAQS
jgi:hypothetical protein